MLSATGSYEEDIVYSSSINFFLEGGGRTF